jgi:hypothetical protein
MYNIQKYIGNLGTYDFKILILLSFKNPQSVAETTCSLISLIVFNVLLIPTLMLC